MKINRRIVYLVVIMTLVALMVALVAIFALYNTALNQHRAHLEAIVQTQAHLLEAVARFDAEHSQSDHPEGSHAATFSQLQEALEGYSGIGETGEFTVGKLEGDNIEFLLRQRMGEIDDPMTIPISGQLAEPMRRALNGESGTVISLDYEGTRVLAAYQPVELLELGLVVKVDMAEIYAPFLRAAGVSLGVAITVIALGAYTFFRISDPLVRQLEKSHEVLEEQVAERTLELQIERSQFRDLYVDAPVAYFSINRDGIVERVNNAGSLMFGMSKSEIVGRSVFDLYADTPGGRERAKEVFACFLGGEEILEEELEYLRTDGTHFYGSLTVRTLCNEAGEIIRSRSTVTDITGRKEAELALKYTNQFRELLTRLSTNFIDIPIDEIDSAIHQTLQEVGTFVDARQFSINLYSSDKARFSRISEWVPAGVSPTKSKYQDIPISGFGWIEDGALRGETYILRDTTDLDPDGEIILPALKSMGAKAVLGIPLTLDDDVIGFISIYLANPETAVSNSTIELLQVVGQIFVNALHRKQTQSQLTESLQEMRFFHEINTSALQHLPLDELTNKALAMFAELLGTRDLMFYLYDSNKQHLVNRGIRLTSNVQAHIEKMASVHIQDVAPVLGDGNRFRSAMETGQSFILTDRKEVESLYAEFTDSKALKKFVKPVMKILNVKNTGAVPLVTGDDWLGLITFNTDQEPTADILKRLDRAGAQVALAILRVQTEQALRHREERYRTIFETAAVSIWVEDFSEVKAAIDDLRSQGVKDFRKYFDEHPEFIQKVGQMIKVVDVNSETLNMFGANSKAELLGSLDKIFLPQTLEFLAEEILAIANGETYFQGETINQTLDGKRLNLYLTMGIPTDPEKMNRILVSLIDITDRVQAQNDLQELNFELECRVAERTNELERSNSLIASLGKISAEVGSMLDTQKIMEIVSARLKELGFENWFGLVDEEGRAIVIQHTSIPKKLLTKAEKLLNLKMLGFRFSKDNWPVYEQIVESAHGAYWEDIVPVMQPVLPGLSENMLRQALRLINVTSDTNALYVPLKSADKNIGMFGMWSDSLDEADLPAFNIFAGQVAASMENSRLFESAQHEIKERKAAERELENHLDQLEEVVLERTAELNITNTQLESEIKVRQEAEQRFRTLIEFAPDGIALMDGERVFRYLSPAVERILGYSQNETHMLDPVELTHPDDVDALTNALRELRKEPWRFITTQYRFRHKNGSWRMLESTISNLLDEPSVKAFVFNFHDITEEQEAQQRFKSLLNSAPDAMIIVNQEGEITLINRQTERIFGYKREELLGKSVEVLIPQQFRQTHPSHRDSFFKDAHVRSMGVELELFAQHADGHEIPVEISLSPIETAQGQLVIAAVRDITSRKETQQRIIELAAFPTENPFPILKSDAAGNMLYVNPAGEEFLAKYDLDSTSAILPEDHRENVKDCIENGQRCGPIEVYIGDSILSWTYHPVQDTDFVHIYAADVTVQKLAEAELEAHRDNLVDLVAERTEELQASEARYRAVVEDQTEYINRMEPDGTLIFANERYSQLFGKSPEEMQGRSIYEFVSDIGAKHIQEKVNQITSDQPTVTDEYQSNDEGRNGIWFQWTDRGIFDSDGNLTAIQAVGRDVTLRKESEEALKLSEQKFRAIVQDQTEFLVRYTPDTTRTFVNESYARHLNRTIDDLVGTRIIDEVTEADKQRIKVKLAAMTPENPVSKDEYRSFTPEGDDLWEAWIDRGIFDENGSLVEVQAVGRDITQRKQFEHDLKIARDAAESASLAKSQFLANMSHELRTPMNSILGFAQLLDDQVFGEVNQKQARYISNIRVSGQHLLNLINEVLDLSKIEAGRVKLELVDTNLNSLIMSAIDNTRGLADQKKLALTMELEESIPPIQADPIRLNQVMINLLSNAIKFTPDNGRVLVRTHRQDHRVIIAVSDTGIGINPDDQERIFEKFEQVESDYGRRQEGTGLGLALTKQLIELHGGRIWVESEGEGQGSTFFVELPL